MSRIHATLRGGLVLSAILALGACSDRTPTARVFADGAPASGSSALATVNLRRMADSVASALVAKGSGGYVVPTGGALDTFRLAVDTVTAGHVAAADSLLGPYGYDVYRFREAGTGDTLVALRERVDAATKKFPRGWGFYAFNPNAANDVDIHVNHPVDDQHSEDIAADLYQGCRCRWFLMAGTRRAANVENDTISDMARHTSTVFHQVHARVAAAGTRAVSVHGFNLGNHDDELPDSVTHVLAVGRSSATTTPTYGAADIALRTALVDSAFRAGLHDLDAGYDALGATHNPQGRHSNDVLGWGHWIHVEHERVIRDDTTAWKKSNRILRRWIEANPAP